MYQGLDSQVKQQMDAYRGNPQALMQKYQQNQELIDLLALQKLKSEKEAAAREMQMQMQQSPQTIKDQREQQVAELTENEVVQQVGLAAPAQRGKMQKQQIAQAMQGRGGPDPRQSGIASAPMQKGPKMAAGGLVSFAKGGPPPLIKRPSEENYDDTGRYAEELDKATIERIGNVIRGGASPEEALQMFTSPKAQAYIRSAFDIPDTQSEGDYVDTLYEQSMSDTSSEEGAPKYVPTGDSKPASMIDSSREALSGITSALSKNRLLPFGKGEEPNAAPQRPQPPQRPPAQPGPTTPMADDLYARAKESALSGAPAGGTSGFKAEKLEEPTDPLAETDQLVRKTGKEMVNTSAEDIAKQMGYTDEELAQMKEGMDPKSRAWDRFIQFGLGASTGATGLSALTRGAASSRQREAQQRKGLQAIMEKQRSIRGDAAKEANRTRSEGAQILGRQADSIRRADVQAKYNRLRVEMGEREALYEVRKDVRKALASGLVQTPGGMRYSTILKKYKDAVDSGDTQKVAQLERELKRIESQEIASILGPSQTPRASSGITVTEE